MRLGGVGWGGGAETFELVSVYSYVGLRMGDCVWLDWSGEAGESGLNKSDGGIRTI
jgi:hypothetical protein